MKEQLVWSHRAVRVNWTWIRVPDHNRWSQSWKLDSLENDSITTRVIKKTCLCSSGHMTVWVWVSVAARYLSSWANMERWQSPKSKPQIFTFLSAEPVAISVLSWLTETQGQSQAERTVGQDDLDLSTSRFHKLRHWQLWSTINQQWLSKCWINSYKSFWKVSSRVFDL